MLSEKAKEGCEIVIFQWSTHNGVCFDCGLPAAFRLTGHKAYLSKDWAAWKLCAVCAANAACDGERIERIEPFNGK